MPNWLKKAISCARAFWSGKDPELQAARDKICQGCDQFVERAVKNIKGRFKMVAHCKACGCGSNPMANIKGGKNGYVQLSCPMWKWPGDLEGTGLTLRDANALHGARDRLQENLATVENLIDRGTPMSHEVLAQVYGQQIANQIATNNAQRPATPPAQRVVPAREAAKPCCKEKAPQRTRPLRILAAATHTTENLAGAGV